MEYQPGELFVKQYVRPEYIEITEDRLNARRVIAALPAMPLEKSITEPITAHASLVNKWVDHQPVYRQLEIFKRQDVTINHSTVSGWIKDAMELIEPVYNLHCKEVLNTDYLGVDETTIKVLDKDKRALLTKGYYWVYYDTGREVSIVRLPAGQRRYLSAEHAAQV